MSHFRLYAQLLGEDKRGEVETSPRVLYRTVMSYCL